jgi:hypothetical protein
VLVGRRIYIPQHQKYVGDFVSPQKNLSWTQILKYYRILKPLQNIT